MCRPRKADFAGRRFEVVLVRKMSRLRIASVLAKYKAGAHIAEDGNGASGFARCVVLSSRPRSHIIPVDEKNTIVNIDGECGPAERLDAW